MRDFFWAFYRITEHASLPAPLVINLKLFISYEMSVTDLTLKPKHSPGNRVLNCEYIFHIIKYAHDVNGKGELTNALKRQSTFK